MQYRPSAWTRAHAAAEPQPGSRQRLIAAATQLFSRQGYEATGVKHIAEQASAPMGSFYFHFPGGKEELGVAALDHGAERFAIALDRALTSVDAIEDALPACARLLAEDLPASQYADGCPVATAALESVVRSRPSAPPQQPPSRRGRAFSGTGWPPAASTTERPPSSPPPRSRCWRAPRCLLACTRTRRRCTMRQRAFGR